MAKPGIFDSWKSIIRAIPYALLMLVACAFFVVMLIAICEKG